MLRPQGQVSRGKGLTGSDGFQGPSPPFMKQHTWPAHLQTHQAGTPANAPAYTEAYRPAETGTHRRTCTHYTDPHACMHTHIHTHANKHAQSTHTHAHACQQTRTSTHTHTHAHACQQTRTEHTHACTRMPTNTHRAHTHAHACQQTRTEHTHIHKRHYSPLTASPRTPHSSATSGRASTRSCCVRGMVCGASRNCIMGSPHACRLVTPLSMANTRASQTWRGGMGGAGAEGAG